MCVRWEAAAASAHLVGATSRDEDRLICVLLKVPGLHSKLLLQLRPVLRCQEEVLRAAQHQSWLFIHVRKFPVTHMPSMLLNTA